MAELSTKEQTEAAAADLNAKIAKILDLPLEEAVAFVPQVAEAARVLNDTARAEILELDGRQDMWRERALAAEKKLEPQGQPSSPKPPEPARRDIRSFKIDPKFNPNDYSGEEGQALKLAHQMIVSTAARKPASMKFDRTNVGDVAGACVNAEMEDYGRTDQYYLRTLEALLHGYGADYAVTESARLFDYLEPNLTKQTKTINGVSHTWWEFRWQAFSYSTGLPLSKDEWNRKENALAHATLSTKVRIMAENLDAHPENAARVKRGKEILLALDRKWVLMYKGKRRVPGNNDRVIHPFTDWVIYHDDMAFLLREDDPQAAKEHAAQRDLMLPMLAAELMPYTDKRSGVKCYTHAYNVLQWTTKDSKPGSDAYIEDGYQFTVYTYLNAALFLVLGMRGYKPFSTRDVQAGYAAGNYFGTQSEAPYNWLLANGNKGVGMTDMDISPREYDWLDQKNDPRPPTITLKNEYQTRRLRKEREEDSRNGSSYRREVGNVEGFPIGLALAFGPDEMVEHSEHFYFGPLDKPRIGGSRIFTPVGRALRHNKDVQAAFK